MSCIITYNKQGKATVKTPQGLDSTLYQEALDITGSQKKALEVVATIYSPEYQGIFTEELNTEPSFSKVIAFMNAKRVDELTITEDDILEVANIAFENNVESLTDLETMLTSVFRPNGLLDIDQERLEESGMYNQPDIADLMNGNFNENSLNRTIDVVSKMIQDNMALPLVDNDRSYNITDTSVKNSLGMSKKMSDNEILDIILNETKGYTSQADFSNKMQGLEVTPIVSRYNSDENFAKQIFDNVSKYQVVPNAEIVNGELTLKQKGSTVSAINSTILLNTDSTELRSEIEDLLEIDNDILENDIEDTKEFVKKIEMLAADVNIDIVGLSEKTVPQIKEVLSATALFAKKATQERIKNADILAFSEIRDKVLSLEGSRDDSFETIDEQYRGYNIVKLYTELGNEELFTEYGLVKIGENLYHRVDISNDSTETLYDNLYRQLLEGTFELPKEYKTPKEKFDPNNKPIILESLKSFINSKKNDFNITNVQVNERISLTQTLFKHKDNVNSDINKVDAGNILSGIKTNLNYLRTQFISDLYKYTLTEKQKGSQVYKQILSKLEFNNRDITLKSTDNSIQYALIALGDRFKYNQELRDYAAIKKNDPIKALHIPTGVSPRVFPNVERISLANNPTLLGEYVGTIKRNRGYIITNTNDSFIKVNDTIYEKVGKNIFAPIETTPSTNYYTIPTLTIDTDTIKMLEVENPAINISEPYTLASFREKFNTSVLTDKQVALLSDLNATPHQTVRNSYTTKYGSTEINFTLNGRSSNNVTIELIQTDVDSRGQGLAKAALNDFIRVLDNNQFSSELTVVPRDKNTKEADLIRLYSSVGFRPGAIYDPNGGLVMMERRAKKLVPVEFQVDGETIIPAENLETTKLVSEYLKDKGFPINILSEQDMIEEARKRGYESFDAMVISVSEQIQPLKAGERIHGFYDVNTNEIYLTEELLNSDTLVHETTHFYQKVLEKQAKSGNLAAANLLNRFNEIGLEVLGGEAKLAEYYNNTNATSSKPSLDFSVSNNFENWKGENELVAGTSVQEIRTGQPVVIRGYHGTTNEFYEFDSSVKGSIEGHLGRVNYFTTDYQDASQNYLTTGADITSRVETLKDRVLSTLEFNLDESLEESDRDDAIKAIISENYPDFDSSSLDFDMSLEEVAQRVSSSMLIGGEEMVLDLFIKLNNPVVLGNGRTWFETLNVSQSDLDIAAEEIAEENDTSVDEAKEEYSFDIQQRAIDNTGYENLHVEALRDALSKNGYDQDLASEILGDNYYETEVDLNQLEKDIRGAELYDNSEGELASSQVISDFFKNLGFDGIILTDVSDRFQGMSLGSGTSHIHVFDEYNNQIKLADGSNVKFGETSDIRFSTSETNPFNSDVYSPRQNESYNDYKDRMINEAIARLMGENSVEYFETIAKEAGLNKTETRSFIDKVKQFINDFAEWLKTRLGLTDVTPEQLANMTNKELFDIVTTSIAKGDYIGKQEKRITLTERSPLLENYNGMFSKETTGLSYYDDLMNADSENPGYQFFYKGLKARVEMLSPQDYLTRVRTGFGTTTDEAIVDGKKDRIIKAIEEGNKIDMGFLNYSNGSFEQEGRNRASVAIERGEELIPTLIINDVTQEDKNNKAQEFINEALSKGITGEDSVIQYLKDTYNIHRDFTNFLRFKGDNLNFETFQEKVSQFKVEAIDSQANLINKKVKELFTNLSNPINIVTLYTEQDLKEVDACR